MEHVRKWLNNYEMIKICIKDAGAGVMEIYPNKFEIEADYLSCYVGNILNHSAMCALDISKYNTKFSDDNKIMSFYNEESERLIEFIGF